MSDVDKAAWSIDEWLTAMPFKKTFLYEMWRSGEGPRRVTLRGRALILESPSAFLKRTQPAGFNGWQRPR